MYLKSLEINGFKSFAKKVNLDFSVPIVAIVGPNGSGKSNVAEAFHFVLGEQSMKSMRGKRGEDMIFNGGKSLSKLNRASVKLIFDNRKRIFNIDFDEVVLERVVFRDGVNEYSINGSQVRLRDVLELLANANIGSSGHHIISQGEADRILNASIKERKGMIEDALGLKAYQYKREESIKKLEKTDDNIRQVQSLRKEIAPHIKFLEKQIEKVQKAENLRRELVVLYQEYLAREETYLEKKRKAIAEEKRGPEGELRDTEAKISHFRSIIEAAEKMDDGAQDVLDLEQTLREAENAESEAKNRLSHIEGEINAQNRALSRLSSQESHDRGGSVPLKDLLGLKGEIEQLASSANESTDLSFVRSLVAQILGKIDHFLQKRNEEAGTNNLLEEIRSEIAKLEDEKEDLKKKIVTLSENSSKARHEHDNLRRKREEENSKGRVAERELFALMNRRSELNSVLFEIRRAEEILHQDQAMFEQELREAGALIGLQATHFNKDDFVTEDVLEESRNIQEDRRKRLEKMKIRLEEAGGAGGDDVKKEYDEITARDVYLMREIEDLNKSAETLKSLIAELTEKLEVEFKAGISKINSEFQKFFALMFGGGLASLSVMKEEKKLRKTSLDFDSEIGDNNDNIEEEEGIDISVSLPNKRVKGLSMLSGGERALTSIALLFAISQVNPPPFVILDETDAALDEANSRKYGDMVENLSKFSQLILITHNRETMSRASILYGVTVSAEGYSKLLSVKFDEAVAVAK